MFGDNKMIEYVEKINNQTKNKKTIKSYKTKRKISMTAIKLISEKGYNNVSVNEICEASSVTKGAFYHHFKSKEDLLYSSYEDPDDTIMESLDEIYKLDNPLTQLLKITLIYAQASKDKGVEIVKEILRNSLTDNNADYLINYNKREPFKVQLDIIKKAISEGLINNNISAEFILRKMVTNYNGMLLDWCYHNGDYDFIDAVTKEFPFFINRFVTSKYKNIYKEK
jgi:AcrR family transcriptional regulator